MGDDTTAAKSMEEQAVEETATAKSSPSPQDADRQVALRCDASSDKTCDANVTPAKVRDVNIEANIDVPGVTHTPCVPSVADSHTEGESVSLRSVSTLSSCCSERGIKIIRSDPVSTCLGGVSEKNGSDEMTCRCDGSVSHTLFGSCADVSCTPESKSSSDIAGNNLTSLAIGNTITSVCQTSLQDCPGVMVTDRHIEPVSLTERLVERPNPATDTSQTTENDGKDLAYRKAEKRKRGSCRAEGCVSSKPAKRKRHVPPTADSSSHTSREHTLESANKKSVISQNIPALNNPALSVTSQRGEDAAEVSTKQTFDGIQGDPRGERQASESLTQPGETDRLRCQLCGYLFTREHNLARHVKKIHKQAHGELDPSAQDFLLRFRSLAKHSLPCAVCGAQFSQPTELARHVKHTHRKKTVVKQDQAESQPPVKRRHPSWVDMNKKPFGCSSCDGSFMSAAYLSRHKKLVHQNGLGADLVAQTPQPGVESRSEPGSVESRSEPGSVESRSEPGSVESRSEPGSVESRSEPGSVESRSEPGSVEIRSEPDSVESRSEPGSVESRSEPGSVESRSETDSVESRSEPGSVASRSKPGSVKRLDCRKCGESFSKAADFARHVKHVHRRRRVADRKISKFRSVLKKAGGMRLVISVKPFDCTQCGASFCEAVNLSRHVKLAHRGVPPVARSCPLPQEDEGGEEDGKVPAEQVVDDLYRCGLSLADEVSLKTHKKKVCWSNETTPQDTVIDRTTLPSEPAAGKSQPHSEGAVSLKISRKMLHVNQAESDEVGEDVLPSQGNSSSQTGPKLEEDTVKHSRSNQDEVHYQPISNGGKLKRRRLKVPAEMREATTGGEDISYPSCTEKFTKQRKLKRHMFFTHNPQKSSAFKIRRKLVYCFQCPAKFTTPLSLTRHMLIAHRTHKTSSYNTRNSNSTLESVASKAPRHSGKNFSCPVCAKTFSSAWKLKRHKSNVKPCVKRRERNSVLVASSNKHWDTQNQTDTDHERKNLTDTDHARKLSCQECGVRLSTLHNLRRHVSQIHNHHKKGTSGGASVSKRTARSKWTAKRKNVAWECDKCGGNFSTEYNLKRHVANLHNQKQSQPEPSVDALNLPRPEEESEDTPLYDGTSCASFVTSSGLHQPRLKEESETTPLCNKTSGAGFVTLTVTPSGVQRREKRNRPEPALVKAEKLYRPKKLNSWEQADDVSLLTSSEPVSGLTMSCSAADRHAGLHSSTGEVSMCSGGGSGRQAESQLDSTGGVFIDIAEPLLLQTAMKQEVATFQSLIDTHESDNANSRAVNVIQEDYKADGCTVISQPSLDDDRTGSVQILVEKGHLFLSSAGERQQSNTHRVKEEMSSQPGMPTVGVDHNDNLQLTAEDHHPNLRCKPEEKKWVIFGSVLESDSDSLSQIKDEDRITCNQALPADCTDCHCDQTSQLSKHGQLPVGLSSTGCDRRFSGVQTEKNIVMPTHTSTAGHSQDSKLTQDKKMCATSGSEADPNTSKQSIVQEESLCADKTDSVKDEGTGFSLQITPCRVVLVDIRFAVNRLQTMGK